MIELNFSIECTQDNPYNKNLEELKEKFEKIKKDISDAE